MDAPTTFRFLGQSGDLEDIGWDGEQRDKLWRYNQHYFDDLNAQGSNARAEWHRTLLAHWTAANPPASGTGWEPYPTSLRIVNWIKWTLSGNELPAVCVQSLAVQARWLTKRLEIHLLGNHLFANAKALVFAGLFFEGEEAQGWLTVGMDILAREVPEQILADGGHFERSTMYHALALEDMLDLCNLFSSYGIDYLPPRDLPHVEPWRALLPGMVTWLQVMSHPDGDISFFNDAAIGIAPSPAELIAYARRVVPAAAYQPELGPVTWLPQSGYARIATNAAVALLDMAPIGPDYLPGHAHADTLSFELSLYGSRAIVNAGTSRYGLGDQRLRERGTQLHSTLTVAGQDSSEVWGGFRVARRARVSGAGVQQKGDVIEAGASHDGYTRLQGRPVHTRKWRLQKGSLIIQDHVSDAGAEAFARFHLHPDVTLERDQTGHGGRLHMAGGRNASWLVEDGEADVEPSEWHPRFGQTIESSCIRVRLVGGRSVLRIDWSEA